MKRIRKLLPLLFATTLIGAAIALTTGLASAAPNCTGNGNQKALCHAREQVGKKCSWDAKQTKALACARIGYEAYRKAGLKGNYLPASGSYNKAVKLGWTVPVKDRKAGDLLYFNSSGQGVDRVGIYAGKDRVIIATGSPSSKKSETVKLTELTPARIKQLTKLAVRPVVAGPKVEQVRVNNPMAEQDGTDSCPEPDGGAPDEETPDGGAPDEETPEGDVGTPEGETPAPEGEGTEGDTPEGDGTEGDGTEPVEDDVETPGGDDTTTTSGDGTTTTTTTTTTTGDGTTTTTTTTTGGDTSGGPESDADTTGTEPAPDADSPEGDADTDSPDTAPETDADADTDNPDGDAPETDAETDSPDSGAPDTDSPEGDEQGDGEGDGEGDAACGGTEDEPTTDGEPTTEPTDDCVDTDVVDHKIVSIDPSGALDDKPGVVEPATAGDNGTGTNPEEAPCDRP
ncbi:NlpC/P60 family protein [Micromonospora sp. NBC_01699]|uniref:NlpC/P60 family protein n=1 Tax=Micromonospora sp. NBC_01699 TaxID=2975984 RepID=UPI002E2E6625|nr:NlpC/P60 family protein [Micromonospora sp. NBC_01699]